MKVLFVDFYTDDLILVFADPDPKREVLFLSRKEMNEGAFANEQASARLDRLIAELRKATDNRISRWAAGAFLPFGT